MESKMGARSFLSSGVHRSLGSSGTKEGLGGLANDSSTGPDEDTRLVFFDRQAAEYLVSIIHFQKREVTEVFLTGCQQHRGVFGVRSQLEKLLRILLQLQEELSGAAGIRIFRFRRTSDVLGVGLAGRDPTVLRRMVRRAGFGLRHAAAAGLLSRENHVRLLHSAEDKTQPDVSPLSPAATALKELLCSLEHLRMKLRQTMASGCDVLLL